MCVSLAVLFLLVGLSLVYLFIKVKHSSTEVSKLHPNQVLLHSHKAPHHSRFDRNLDDVFISVKTTKKYHYPRLIIQLETWVSLVKSQVSTDPSKILRAILHPYALT